jgi:hypothetical protein
MIGRENDNHACEHVACNAKRIYVDGARAWPWATTMTSSAG